MKWMHCWILLLALALCATTFACSGDDDDDLPVTDDDDTGSDDDDTGSDDDDTGNDDDDTSDNACPIEQCEPGEILREAGTESCVCVAECLIQACDANQTLQTPGSPDCACTPPLNYETPNGDPTRATAAIESATAVLQTYFAEKPVNTTLWEWGDAIVHYAGMKLNDAHPDPDLYNRGQAYVDHHIDISYLLQRSDHTPSGAIAAQLWDDTGEQKYRDVLDDIDHYLFEEVPHTPDGGITHWGTTPLIGQPNIYVDSLWMFGLYNMENYVRFGTEQHINLEAEQLQIFIGHLVDPEYKLFYHEWHANKPERPLQPDTQHFWARGNAWAFGAMALWLSVVPEDHPMRPLILATFVAQAEAIAQYQQPSGLWLTVMNDDPEISYEETSASALFVYAYATGMRLGVLPPEYLANVDLALEGLMAAVEVNEEGSYLTMTSLGTNAGDRDHYNEVEVDKNVEWGVGAYVLGALAYERLVP